MKIALYGATGFVGSRIVLEALSRDHLVTAISRTLDRASPRAAAGGPATPRPEASQAPGVAGTPGMSPRPESTPTFPPLGAPPGPTAAPTPAGLRARRGDAAEPIDVARVAAEHDVVVSAIAPSRTGQRHQIFLHALSVLAENVGTRRLVVVGGSGSLQVAPGLRLMDMPGFSPRFLPEAITHVAALELLRDTGALVDWLYVSPAPALGPGARTGTYRIGMDEVVGDWVSVEDFAVAIVDELETPRYHRTRIHVAH
jgi:putative NADH-flavin reductase